MVIAVFCASSTPADECFVQVARELGDRIARSGHTLVYGGSNLGLMGAVSGAALTAGGRVVGVIPRLFPDSIIYSQQGVELELVGSMAERKERIIAMSDAFVALPGGVGTLDELCEVLVANQLSVIEKPISLLNVNGYYEPLLHMFESMMAAGMMRRDGKLNLKVAVNVDEALAF